MAKFTHTVLLTAGQWTALSGGEENVIVQMATTYPVVIALASSAADLSDSDGHPLIGGAVPFYGIGANVYARPTGQDGGRAIVTRW